MKNILLYSTNAQIKFDIQKRYFDNYHYVWCSVCYDANQLGQNEPDHEMAPSSNPKAIYKELEEAVIRGDRHCTKIESQKTIFKSLAVQYCKEGRISEQDKEEIFYIVENADMSIWKPYLYIIPTHLVEDRLNRLPPERWAGIVPEYTINNLRENEFHRIRL